MSNNSTLQLHCHWDCDSILSSQVLFRSSLNALRQKENCGRQSVEFDEAYDNKLITTINCIVNTLLTDKLPFDFKVRIGYCDDETFGEGDVDSNTSNLNSYFEPHTIPSDWNVSDIHSMLVHMFMDVVDDGNLQIFGPATLSKSSLRILRNIFESISVEELVSFYSPSSFHPDVSERSEEDLVHQYFLTIFYMIGTVWILLDCLQIQSFSCSALPINSLVVRTISHHLVHVPIQIYPARNNNEQQIEFSLHVDGLVLLRHLLLLSTILQNYNEACPPYPFQLIQPVAIGDAPILPNNSKASRRCCIYLLLGKVIIPNQKLQTNNEHTSSRQHSTDDGEAQQHFLHDATSSFHDVTWTEMLVLEANIDDMSSEHLAHATETLLNFGKAADVWTTSITMKKGRSAHTLHCLCRTTDIEGILPIFFQNTTTLGVRITNVDRIALKRTIITIPVKACLPMYDDPTDTQPSGIDVKIGFFNGKVTSIKAEYDHCQFYSKATGIPIHHIAAKVVEAAQNQLVNA